ncbi:hypothetical protein CLV84_1228 [Neolewinella xylanilytica]|uniref:PRMT5 arginine-N-methyltransferase domain-containing protein n=1 Tax=Neolewinella xylanilytica TaxID=1514080 RepID=A0A2S6I9U0_9BACT|nr:hypothetical protein [Neolewinella xylanilytica]PPK88263.1 hypothetical protein CLV84_1228 [Neolewinella xylanilytica]
MTRLATLAAVADVLLDDATSPSLLHDTLEQYRDLLLTASGLDLGDDSSLKPFDTGRGIAIGATWAALCIDDELRTQRFIAGLHAAVNEAIAAGSTTPVHVVYAGTGPFATLALPLMTRFPAEQLQFTFLEINAVSLAAVERLIDALGIGAYVRDVVLTDASTYQLPDRTVDILLSETMQFSLVDEMQVPITLNLLRQLPATTVLIPERITLRLGRLAETEGEPLVEDLGELLVIDRHTLRSYVRNTKSSDFPTVTLPLPPAGGLFAIRTGIQIFGGYRLEDYESGLTNPEIIGRFPDEEGTPETVEFTYQMEPCPYLRMLFRQNGAATPSEIGSEQKQEQYTGQHNGPFAE